MPTWTPKTEHFKRGEFLAGDIAGHPVTKTLNELMSFGHVIRVHSDGTVTEPHGMHGPEAVYQELDQDGQCIDDEIHDMPAGWSLMTSGYTGQYGYDGPVMHPSEYIGGQLAQDILASPGYYVAVTVDGMPYGDDESADDDDLSIGWAVAYKESE